eukprot:7160271-Karenia_brevis.AAC.1
MIALQRDDGSFATDPDKMDTLIRSTWEQVYRGNISNPISAVIEYVCKYAHYIFRAPSWTVPPLDAEELQDVISQCSQSAAGLDSWSYEDLKLLPLLAYQCLVPLLELIEEGAPWPDQLLR